MKADDLDFLSNHWNRLQEISKDISDNLHKDVVPNKLRKYEGSKVLRFVNYSDLNGSWDIKELSGNSLALKALGDKISNMIDRGRSLDIEPMLRKIVSGRTKRLYAFYRTEYDFDSNFNRVNKHTVRDFIGVGHFRWNYRAYILNEDEIKKIKQFFSL